MRNEAERSGWVEREEEEGSPDRAVAAGLPLTAKEKPKPRLKPIHRQQLILRTVDVERLVPEDHEVRAIWELVGQLDLSPYYEQIRAVEGVAGRDPVDPQLLISLWIYSYAAGVSSAREISRLCEHHPAYQWLTGMEVINHHTLSDFRVDHREALDELFAEVLGLLSAEGLITLERVMQDGTRIKACAGADTFRREGRLESHLEMARQHVAAMGDPRSEQEVSPRVRAARQRAAREKQQRLELALQELEKIRASKSGAEAKAEARASQSDPEARVMKQSDGGWAPSYNVQLSTDAAAGIIVGVGVSQSGSDYEQLVPAVDRLAEQFGQAPAQVVADGGFTSRPNILDLDQRGVDFIGSMGEGAAQSAGQMDRRGVDPAFRPEAFSYDTASNTYSCPGGQILKYAGKEERPGRTNYQYRAKASDCQGCPLKEQCCPQNASKGRMIVRGVDHPMVVAFNEKMQTQAAQQIYKQRGAVAEFPNAWIKEKIGLRQFRLRGLIKVGMETLWTCLTYNIQQWIRLRWRVRWAESRA
jgi:transposase